MDDAARAQPQGAKDKMLGRAKEIIGDAVGSDTLAAKGRLQQQEGVAEQEAAELRAQAEQERLAAQDVAIEGARLAAARRADANVQERERKASLEVERARAHALAEAEASAEEAAVERVAAARESALDAREQRARAQRDAAVNVAEERLDDAARAQDNAAELEQLEQDVQQG